MTKLIKRKKPPHWYAKHGQRIYNHFGTDRPFRCDCGASFTISSQADDHRCKRERERPWKYFINDQEVDREMFEEFTGERQPRPNVKKVKQQEGATNRQKPKLRRRNG